MIDTGAAGWVSPDYEHQPPTVCILLEFIYSQIYDQANPDYLSCCRLLCQLVDLSVHHSSVLFVLGVSGVL